MIKQTSMQNLIEQNTASGGFYDKLNGFIGKIIPHYLHDTQNGLQVYLMNLDYKSGNILLEDSREKRRRSHVVYDENFGTMIETSLNDWQESSPKSFGESGFCQKYNWN